jgi:hypothetical protein
MASNKTKRIYIPLIIIAIILSFLCGVKIGNAKDNNKITLQSAKLRNIHYNETVNVKGPNYSIDYSIMNALFFNKSLMDFNIALRGNNNVSAIKVVAKDQNNEYLKVDTIPSADTNFLEDTIKLNTKTTKIYIYVYPLTKDMLTKLNNKTLDLSSIPVRITELDVSLLKVQQIQN